MVGRFEMNESIGETVAQMAQPDVLNVAEEIAVGTAAKAADPDYAGTVTVEATDDGAWVGTDHPFAHLDEWGSVNNPPTAAMRSAAAAAGRFVEE